MDKIIDGSQICWFKSQGTADASDLGFPPGHFPERFNVQSHITDQVIKFVHVVAHETGHLYTSCGLTKPVTVTVFND
jgi:hypothetical protein